MLNRGRTSKWVKHFVIVASHLFLFLDMGNLMDLCKIHFFKGGNCTLFILTPRIVNYIWYGTGTVRYLCICTLDVHTAVQESVHVRYMFVTVLVIYIRCRSKLYPVYSHCVCCSNTFRIHKHSFQTENISTDDWVPHPTFVFEMK